MVGDGVAHQTRMPRGQKKNTRIHSLTFARCLTQTRKPAIWPRMRTDVSTQIVLGPAMMALTDQQRAFVISHNNSGGRNGAESARAAGYAVKTARQEALRQLHNPKIQAALLEDIKTRFTGDLGLVYEGVRKIATTAGHTQQLKALELMAHHGGLVQNQKIDMTVTHEVDFTGLMADAKTLVGALTSVDPKLREALATKFGPVTDAEFEDVTPVTLEDLV
jgi:hypothetical protein